MKRSTTFFSHGSMEPFWGASEGLVVGGLGDSTGFPFTLEDVGKVLFDVLIIPFRTEFRGVFPTSLLSYQCSPAVDQMKLGRLAEMRLDDL